MQSRKSKTRKKGAFDLDKFRRFKAASGSERLRLRNELIVENLPFVAFKARHYREIWDEIELDELLAVGAIALTKVLERYDPDKSSFASYTALYLRGAFQEYSTLVTDIRVPRQIRLPLKAFAEAEALAAKEGREMAFEDVQKIALGMKIPKWVVATAGEVRFSFEGIWNNANPEGGYVSVRGTPREERYCVPPSSTDTETEYSNAEERAQLDAAMLACSDEHRRILKKHFWDEGRLTEAEREALEDALEELRDHFP